MGSRSRCLVLVIGIIAIAGTALMAQPPQARAAEITQAPQQGAMVFQGNLIQINTDTKMLTVKGPENKEMTFAYTDGTEIIGAGNGVQGLAGKSGERVKITYSVKQGSASIRQIASK